MDMVAHRLLYKLCIPILMSESYLTYFTEYIMESLEYSVKTRKGSRISKSSARGPINLSMRSSWRRWASTFSQIILIHATLPSHPLL